MKAMLSLLVLVAALLSRFGMWLLRLVDFDLKVFGRLDDLARRGKRFIVRGVFEGLTNVALLLLGLYATAWLLCERKACIGEVVLCHQF